jgi:2,3-bisphosphoglycerate-independent phosphoglycerate mutase
VDLDVIEALVESADTKIVLLVMDGLGGLAGAESGKTALEAARTPHLDKLAAQGICGLHESVRAGITPGSGPAHLALFGYDPLRYQVGRGVLAALGIGFDLQQGDVAARGNFCTVDEEGRIADRRAGRIPTSENEELCGLLRQIELPDVEVFVETVKEYRLLLVLRGEGLSGAIEDTDPQEVGEKPLDPEPRTTEAQHTADLVREFVRQAGEILSGREPANMVLLRGFSKRPSWPRFPDVFGLRAGAVAAYPMYRGVAKLVGMDVLESGSELEEEFATVERHWEGYDFYFLHAKHIDSAGEDGNMDEKVARIEEVDALVPRLLDLEPDVLVVTGDHSTPVRMRYHSWHPVPTLLWSEYCRRDDVSTFGETACLHGGLGPRFPATDLMPLALAHARRLRKFGA